jgi:DNA-binding transcriptional ArsR family regulator
MSIYDLTPIPVQALTTHEQVRAYVNPTRITILVLLAQEKSSVSKVARQLGVHPANLTHHFKLLEKSGLIELVEKRDTGKNLEKYYRAKAYHFTVNTSNEPLDQKLLVLSILRDNLTAALQTLTHQADDQNVLGVLKTVRLSPEDVQKFGQKLLALAEEFGRCAAETGVVYSLNASFYPTLAENLPTREITIRTEP